MKTLALLVLLAIPATAAEPRSPVGLITVERYGNVASDITFMSAGEPALVIHADGRITVGKNAKPDEAARAVLKALETMLRNRECIRAVSGS